MSPGKGSISSKYSHGIVPLRGSTCQKLLFSLDWSTHPLGPLESWPGPLKTTLNTIFHSRNPMFIWWGSGLYQFYNDAYLPSFGVGKHPLAMGQRGEECWPEIWSIIKPQIDLVMNGEGATWNENQLVPIFRNGRVEDVYWTYGYSPLFLDEGAIGGVLVVCNETTITVEKERLLRENADRHNAMQAEIVRKLQASHQQLHDFFMQAPNPMVILEGPEFRFLLANPPYESMIGRKAVGKTVLEVFSEEEIAHFLPFLKSVFETGVPFTGKEMTLHLPDKDGVLVLNWIDLSYHPFRNSDGIIIGLLAMIQNVTDQVLSRKAIEFAKGEAESAKEKAEQANQTKSAFLANMSHEIRTPLGAILGFAELVKEPNIRRRDKDQYVETILKNGRALTRIIDDILDLAKVESGKLEMEMVPFQLMDLIHEVVELFKEKTREKAISLKVISPADLDARVFSDPTRVRQILINLIGNSIKFTKNGSVKITITMEKCGEVDTRDLYSFRIYVEDTGVGIIKEQQERLFQPFVQADNTTTRLYGGSGLGLVLSQRLAKALGGSIEIVSSEPGIGSVFMLQFMATIDAKPTNSASKPVPVLAALKPPLEGVKILLADDSNDNLFLASRILVKNGGNVVTVSNGKLAVAAASDESFDLILMDIQMPEMDGYEATKILRNMGCKIPIVALTAHAMNEEIALTLAAGCNAHLTKPFNQVEMVNVLQRELAMNRS